jgi:hypothetical protein
MRPGRLRRARSARVGAVVIGYRVRAQAPAGWARLTTPGMQNPGRAGPLRGLLALPSKPSGAWHASSHGRHRGTPVSSIGRGIAVLAMSSGSALQVAAVTGKPASCGSRADEVLSSRDFSEKNIQRR